MQKKYSREIPNKVERMGGKFILNYHLQETTEEEILSLWENENIGNPNGISQPDDYFKEEHKYNFNQVIVPMGKWKYDEVVSAIIRDKYREDEMEAIINNKMKSFFEGSMKEDEEYNQMQEWRVLAKSVAKSIFKNGYSI